MSEHYFCPTRAKLTSSEVKKLEAIAAKNHSQFDYQGSVQGQPLTGWFVTTNLGYPFEKLTYDAVMAEINKAGLEEKF